MEAVECGKDAVDSLTEGVRVWPGLNLPPFAIRLGAGDGAAGGGGGAARRRGRRRRARQRGAHSRAGGAAGRRQAVRALYMLTLDPGPLHS